MRWREKAILFGLYTTNDELAKIKKSKNNNTATAEEESRKKNQQDEKRRERERTSKNNIHSQPNKKWRRYKHWTNYVRLIGDSFCSCLLIMPTWLIDCLLLFSLNFIYGDLVEIIRLDFFFSLLIIRVFLFLFILFFCIWFTCLNSTKCLRFFFLVFLSSSFSLCSNLFWLYYGAIKNNNSFLFCVVCLFFSFFLRFFCVVPIQNETNFKITVYLKWLN